MKNNIIKAVIGLLIYGLTWYIMPYILPENFVDTHEFILGIGLNAAYLVLFAWLFKDDLKKAWNSIDSWKDFWNKDIGYGGMFVGLIFAGAMFLTQILSDGQRAVNQESVEVIVQSYPFILVLILGGIIVPVVEELVYRLAFRQIIKNDRLFLIISSLLFGLAHVTTGDWLFLFPYSIVGLAFGIVYLKTKNIWSVIGIHMLLNISSLLFSYFF